MPKNDGSMAFNTSIEQSTDPVDELKTRSLQSKEAFDEDTNSRFGTSVNSFNLSLRGDSLH